MSTQRPLGLPPITPELKSLTPYLQRADEVKNQEPIIAYWCKLSLVLFDKKSLNDPQVPTMLLRPALVSKRKIPHLGTSSSLS